MHVGAGDNRMLFAAAAALAYVAAPPIGLPPSRCGRQGDCCLRAVPFAAYATAAAVRRRPACWLGHSGNAEAPGALLRPLALAVCMRPGPSRIPEFAVAGPLPALLGSTSGGSAQCQVQLYKASGRGPAAQNSTSCFIMYYVYFNNAVPDTGPHGTILACTTLHQGKAAPHLHAPH